MVNSSRMLAQHPHFWAMPGMLIDSPEDGVVRCLKRNDHQGPPVLSDWATQGCLLELLRESRNVKHADVRFEQGRWTLRCDIRDQPLELTEESLGDALASAILAAWEQRYYDALTKSRGERLV